MYEGKQIWVWGMGSDETAGKQAKTKTPKIRPNMPICTCATIHINPSYPPPLYSHEMQPSPGERHKET